MREEIIEEIKPLSPPRMSPVDENNPFNGDLFNRKEVADQLTGYLDRLRDGAVIAIDAPWGEGKSWFGKNWAADLKKQDYRVVYLDAFKQDYVEDPFLLIASEINEVIATDDTTAQEIKQKAAEVMKAILPLGAKMLLDVAGRIVLGTADASKKVEEVIQSAGKSASEATQKWFEDKIQSHSDEKESLESFRKALQGFCKSQEKPVVFFIDELDRCRPDFSVKLIERLKHFFDVPNLVFVLLLNQDQLEKAIKGVYGAETDAAAYLRKFIHMDLRLPKDVSNELLNANWNYLNQLKDHYKFPENQFLKLFISDFSFFASKTNMSLRDLEKAMALLALNGVTRFAIYFAWLFAWLIVLKLKYPEICNGLLKDDINAHKKAAELLQGMFSSKDDRTQSEKYFLAYHNEKAYGKDKLTGEQRQDLRQFKSCYGENPIIDWLKRLDISA